MKSQRSGRIAQLEKNGLIRKLGVADLFAVGYGDLGSSIFYALGITTLFSLGAAPISLLLAGIVFVCTCLTYAEMTASLRASGGSAVFTREAFNDLISFIAGWGLLLDFIVTLAISVFAIAPYLTFLFKGFGDPVLHIGFSIGLIAVLYYMNYFGAKHSTRVSIVLTSLALATQFLIIMLAFFSDIDFARVFQEMRINAPSSWSPSWAQFWKGTAMAMVAYTGIESIAALGAETKRPVKTLPRAVMIVMGVLVFMYMAISIVGLAAVTPKALGTEYLNNPIVGIVENLPFGSKLIAPWVGLLAALLLFVAGNAAMMGASRLSFNMGEHYQLPRFFYKTHKQYRTPVVSLAIFALLACLVILWSRGSLHVLADLYNFGAMLAFTSAHISLVVLRFKKPDMKRPFKAPLNIRIGSNVTIPLTAVIGGLATFSVWILVIITKPEGRYLGFLWMGLGILMYLAYRKKKQIAATGQLKIDKVKVPGFEPVKIDRILVPTKGGAETETVQMACEIAKVHNAKVTAITLIDIPFSLPLNSRLPYREVIAASAIKRAEAIAREFGVDIETEIVKARSIEHSILSYLEEGEFDLLVLGALKSKEDPQAGLSHVTERLLRRAPCRVFITSSFA